MTREEIYDFATEVCRGAFYDWLKENDINGSDVDEALERFGELAKERAFGSPRMEDYIIGCISSDLAEETQG